MHITKINTDILVPFNVTEIGIFDNPATPQMFKLMLNIHVDISVDNGRSIQLTAVELVVVGHVPQEEEISYATDVQLEPREVQLNVSIPC